MNNELDTIIALKYGTLSNIKAFVDNLPIEVVIMTIIKTETVTSESNPLKRQILRILLRQPKHKDTVRKLLYETIAEYELSR